MLSRCTLICTALPLPHPCFLAEQAPMENHHLAASFRLLRRRDLNFMSRVPKEEQGAVRKTVSDRVCVQRKGGGEMMN